MTTEEYLYATTKAYVKGATDFMEYAKKHHRGVSIYEYELEDILMKFLEQFGTIEEIK